MSLKKGDRVQRISGDNAGMNEGEKGIVTRRDFGWEGFWYVEVNGKETGSHDSSNLKLVESNVETNVDRPTRFILQYELDRDPFETFATMKEVEARIKELSLRSDFKRESIKVYEIAKAYDVSLETRVVFNGLLGPKIRMEEKPVAGKKPAKRGRPNGMKKCEICGGRYKRLLAHMVRSHKDV